MTYKMEINGTSYYVETERHGYRTRFYGIAVLHSGAEPDGKGGFVPCQWDRMGYIGSYYPGSKSCGYSDQYGHDYSTDARGPKTAARLCLAWYLTNVRVAA